MAQGPILLAILAAAVALIILATSRLKLHPFLVLLTVSYLVGIAVGLPGDKVVRAIAAGFGGTLGQIGIVIISGTIIGVILERTGAAVRMASGILRLVGLKRAPLAMSATGYIVSIPVFCDSGFVVLNPLNRALAAESGVPMAAMAVVLATGLNATHLLVPPTPGPLAASGILGVDLGRVIFLGLLVSIPAAISGFIWGTRYARRIRVKNEPETKYEQLVASYGLLPGAVRSFAPIAVPIILIAVASIASLPSAPFGKGSIAAALTFVGSPITALLIGVGLALTLLPRFDTETLHDWIGDGVKQAAMILAVTGAGGAFGSLLKATPIGDYLGGSLAGLNIGLFLPFIVAAALKTAQGSGTVALLTTASLTAPLLPALGLDSGWGPSLAIMAIGSGAMIFSHANDSYFWVISQFGGLTVADAYRAYSAATIIQGLTSITAVFLLSLILL